MNIKQFLITRILLPSTEQEFHKWKKYNQRTIKQIEGRVKQLYIITFRDPVFCFAKVISVFSFFFLNIIGIGHQRWLLRVQISYNQLSVTDILIIEKLKYFTNESGQTDKRTDKRSHSKDLEKPSRAPERSLYLSPFTEEITKTGFFPRSPLIKEIFNLVFQKIILCLLHIC